MEPSNTAPVMPQCPACGTSNAVRLQQVLRGTTAIPVWVCGRCDAEWPADPSDALEYERRAGNERRQMPRPDQRERRR